MSKKSNKVRNSKKKGRNDIHDPQLRIEKRLEVVIVLLAELLSKNDNVATDRVKEKAAALLLEGGVSQDNTARFLGMNRNKVTRISKSIKL